MGNHRTVLILVAIMTAVATIIGGVAIAVLYDTAFKEKSAALIQTAHSQARLIEAIARYDRVYDRGTPGGPAGDTISQIRDAHERYDGFGETGEFTLARREGNNIVFLLRHRHRDLVTPPAISFHSALAEPMRRGLAGESGSLVGLDYRGVTVLAAYEPVAILNLGIVAKVDLAEVRAPFLEAGGMVAAIALVVIAVGTALFFHASNPMVRRIQESEARFDRAVKGTNDGLWDRNITTNEFYLSPRFYRMLGYEVGDFAVCSEVLKDLSHPDDRDRVASALEAHMERRVPYDIEYRLRRKDGEYLWIRARGQAEWDKNGRPTRMAGGVTDVTERKQAELLQRESEARLDAFFEKAPAGLALYDIDGRYSRVNNAFAQITGKSIEEHIGKFPRDVLSKDLAGYVEDEIQKVAKHGISSLDMDSVGETLARPGVSQKWVVARFPVSIANEEISEIGSVIIDITKQMNTEALLTKSEARYRQLVESLPEALFVQFEGQILYANEAAIRLFGAESADRLVGLRSIELLLPNARKSVLNRRDEIGSNGRSTPFVEFQYLRLDGSVFDGESSGTPILWNDQDAILVQVRNITERKRAEEQLRKLSQAVEQSPASVIITDTDGNIEYVNPRFTAVTGYAAEEVIGWNPRILKSNHTSPKEYETLWKTLTSGDEWRGELRNRKKNGELYWESASISPITAPDGSITHFIAVKEDVTERKEMEETLHRQAMVWRKMDEGVLVVDMEDRIVDCNPGAEICFGYTREELLGMPVAQLVKDPRDGNLRKVFVGVGREDSFEDEIVIIHKDGGERIFETRIMPLHDEGGELIATVGVNRDVTERKRAERERTELEKQLRHAHKMEAVGTLAGGIAHDFNNILQGIMGHAYIAEQNLPAESSARSNLDQISHATNRGKEIVRQLLAFSRRDEPTREPVKIEQVVEEALPLIRVSIPATIVVNWTANGDLGTVLVDPTQIHQVLINLCSNATDAIGDRVGAIEIEAENVGIDDDARAGGRDLLPGRYVRLTVSDTGCGMDDHTRERIFDPFFTTKETGEGTGLGLAAAHGIIRDHGGAIEVRTEPGSGTSFAIFLPRSTQNIPVSATKPKEAPAGTERILLVDDEHVIVETIGGFLEQFGYTVSSTTSASTALAIFQSNPDEFDLVVTDQIMPEITGNDLARELTEIRSDIPIILCTGHSDKSIHAKARVAGFREIVEKPIEPIALGGIIRRVLDGKKKHGKHPVGVIESTGRGLPDQRRLDSRAAS